MSIYHNLARLTYRVSGGDPGGRWEFHDLKTEAFAAVRDDGKVVICWRGENYTKQWLSPLTRLHNWLVSRANARSDINN